MAILLAKGVLFFVLVKHGLVSMSTVLLSTLRKHWLARAGLWAATPVYCLLILYHVSMALVGSGY
jgi:hypothetical protein